MKKTKTISLFVLFFIVGIFAYLLIVKERDVSTDVRGIFEIDIPSDFTEDQVKRFNSQLSSLMEKYEQGDQDIEFWLGLGNLYKLMGDFSRAAEAYIKSAEIGPMNTVSYTNLAHLYDKDIGDYVRAEEYYKKAIENNPMDAWLFIDLGKMYKYRMNNMEKQEEILLNAEDLNSNSIDILYALSRFYSDNSNIEKAIHYLEKLIRLAPENDTYADELEKIKE